MIPPPVSLSIMTAKDVVAVMEVDVVEDEVMVAEEVDVIQTVGVISHAIIVGN